MNLRSYIITLFIFLLIGIDLQAGQPYQHELIKEAYKCVKSYNRALQDYHPVMKVVYFHAADQASMSNWQKRLSRTLDSVSCYYREELAKYGISTSGIPFEKRNGQFVIYPVQGNELADTYNPQSGQIIERQIEQQSKGQINFSTDYVLIINGLCKHEKDGIYVFHSPYHGWGSLSSGVCHVADCELLDAQLLTDTVSKMTFSEMSVQKKTCSVAEFNSWYVGGIAHELGHVFGLTHDFGNPQELDSMHMSLMGEYGSRHFKDYLWGGKPASHFSAASVLQLLSHPFFTGKKAAKSSAVDVKETNLSLTSDSVALRLKTSIKSSLAPYALVALVRPTIVDEYHNRSFCSLFDTKTNSFFIEMPKFQYVGLYELRLLYLFPNGFVQSVERNISVDKDGRIDLEEGGPLTLEKLYKKWKKSPQTPIIKEQLSLLDSLIHAPVPIDPSNCNANKLILSDAKWVDAKVGWGQVARNYFSLDDESLFFLQLGDTIYAKGLYAHSPSVYSFNLNGRWKTFTGIVGLRNGAHIQGSARFTVLGDDKVLYESKALRVDMLDRFKVDVSGVKNLVLKTDGTEGHCHNSWAVWANPVLKR